MTKVADNSRELAILGLIGFGGFDELPHSSLLPEEAFHNPMVQVVYAAALSLRRKGQTVNVLTVRDEIEANGWQKRLQLVVDPAEAVHWSSWISHAESTFEFNPKGAIEGMQAIGQCWRERKAAAIFKQAADGELTAAEAQAKLEEITDETQAASLAEVLESRRFDFDNPPKAKPAIFTMGGHAIATAGNIQGIYSHIKSGKTAFVGACLAATMDGPGAGDTFKVFSGNPDGLAVCHWDSEQSPGDHHLALAIATFRAKLKKPPEWLRSYRIADVPAKTRFDLLEFDLAQAKKKHGGIHSVFIDGIADFIVDPNDATESFSAVERLHRLAIQYDTTIFNVLHFNKASQGEMNRTRGHLGSQLERKCETNLCVEKDENGVSVVYTTTSRHTYISKQDGPRFHWSDAHQMHVSCASERVVKAEQHAGNLSDLADEVFAKGPLRWADMINGIKQARGVSQRQAERLQSELKTAGIIVNSGAGQWVRKP